MINKSYNLSSVLLILVLILIGVALFILTLEVVNQKRAIQDNRQDIESNIQWQDEVQIDVVRWREAEQQYYTE